jgi:two-component system, chemotaxis family, chemotaxis protein CheY
MDIRVVDVEGLEEGMLAADDIRSLDGTIIAHKGIELEGRHMRLFKKALISRVRVEVPGSIIRKDTIHIDDYSNNLAFLKMARILIVDDSKFLRFKLEKALTQAGLMVVGQATNGLEAVEQAKALQPNVVTLDIEMPNHDGLSAIVPLHEAIPGLTIIMISSVGEEEKILEALAKGALDFVSKPIEPVNTVRAIINAIVISKS